MSEMEQAQVVADHHMRVDVVAFPLLVGQGCSWASTHCWKAVSMLSEATPVAEIKPEGVGAVFVNDSTPQDVEFARANGHVDFLGPSGTPIAISPENWGRVPRLYVETLRDQGVRVAAQRRMNELLPGADVNTIDTGHSPFSTQPRQLADLLVHAASSAAAAH